MATAAPTLTQLALPGARNRPSPFQPGEPAERQPGATGVRMQGARTSSQSCTSRRRGASEQQRGSVRVGASQSGRRREASERRSASINMIINTHYSMKREAEFYRPPSGAQDLTSGRRREKYLVRRGQRSAHTATMGKHRSAPGPHGAAAAAAALALLLVCLSHLAPVAEAIKLQPEGREKFYWSGEQFVITCQNNNNMKNVKMRWVGPDGRDISEDRSRRVHAESSGPHGHRLVVMNATANVDDGQYKCLLGSVDDNRHPREHIDFQLKLYKQTSFRDTQRHLVLPAGQSGTLNCRVEFDPSVLTASVSWVRDQTPIDMFNDSNYQVVEYDPARQLSQLHIAPLTRQHDGMYTCRAMAVTAQLSKISDFDIQLETTYAPSFERDQQTVWVERGGGYIKRPHSIVNAPPSQASNIYFGHTSGPKTSYNRKDSRLMGAQVNLTEKIVRVELRCRCEANPPATILWTSSKRSNFVLSRGDPEHVIEEPRTEVNDHQTTSVLVVGFNLDPEWPNRDDTYYCSASNKIGKATKSFRIEQGDPPPAFNVAPASTSYDPKTSTFKFTLLGPNLDPDNNHSKSLHSDASIDPPVDMLRLRAEINDGGSSANQHARNYPLAEDSNIRSSPHPRRPGTRDQPDPAAVQWKLQTPIAGRVSNLQLPQNFTISIGRLPAGDQRLYLETHNAVGWSPNSTWIGDFYIVSGASGMQVEPIHLAARLIAMLLACATFIKPLRVMCVHL